MSYTAKVEILKKYGLYGEDEKYMQLFADYDLKQAEYSDHSKKVESLLHYVLAGVDRCPKSKHIFRTHVVKIGNDGELFLETVRRYLDEIIEEYISINRNNKTRIIQQWYKIDIGWVTGKITFMYRDFPFEAVAKYQYDDDNWYIKYTLYYD